MADAVANPPAVSIITAPKLNHIQIIPLAAPCPKLNYLDWVYMLKLHLNTHNIKYLINCTKTKHAAANWDQDIKAVCALISQIVEPVNLGFICQHGFNAHSTWEALHVAHQKLNSTASGRMYWLQKVVNFKMEDDDIDYLIDKLATLVEKLNALVLPGKPLTKENIHTESLLKALPSDWISCVLSLMNELDGSAKKIVLALKAKSLCQKMHSANPPATVSTAKEKGKYPMNHFSGN